MAHNGNAGLHNGPNLLSNAHAALELHGTRATFLHKAARIAHGLLDGRFIAHERHIDNDKRVFRAASDGSTMVDHVFHGYRNGVFVAKHHIAQRVADQNAVDARLVFELRRRVVIRSEHREFFALRLGGGKCCGSILHGIRLSLRAEAPTPSSSFPHVVFRAYRAALSISAICE